MGCVMLDANPARGFPFIPVEEIHAVKLHLVADVVGHDLLSVVWASLGELQGCLMRTAGKEGEARAAIWVFDRRWISAARLFWCAEG